MATATEAKPLPNGTKAAPAFAKIKIRDIDPATLPNRGGAGKERRPSPFDQLVFQAHQSGTTKLLEIPPDDEETRKQVISELRRAAEFHKIGLDVWRTLEDGVAFKTRPQRKRTNAA